MALTTIDPALQNTQAQYTGFKNRIINGAMVIDQRNAGASVTNAGGALTWSVDRWKANASAASKFTMQQNAGSVTPPVGFTKYLGVTSTSAYSLGAGDYFYLSQSIEGLNCTDLVWGTANAKTITVSFWVYSSLTGTFGGLILNSGGNANYAFSYTINSANTWEYKTITILGPTFGSWPTDNSTCIDLRFALGIGSTYSTGTAGVWSATNYYPSGAVNVMGTNGATFYITGVQLEKGSTATSFDYRPYGTELQLCQRYCQVIGGSVSNQMIATAWSYNSTGTVISCQRPVQMRASPTLTYSALGDWQVFNGNAGAYTPTAIGQNRPSSQCISMDFVVSTGLTAGQAGAVLAQSINARLYESAEL